MQEEITSVKMLGLKLPTDPRWVNIAEKSIEDILVDHAFCEQKAATSGISLIVKYPEHKKLVDEVTPLVAEEWGHFRKVLKEMSKRGIELGKTRKDDYVLGLHQHMMKGNTELKLLENLLVCALIEARSCERFRLLSEKLTDPKLRTFYKKLMISEAHHYTLFLKLAKTYTAEEVVQNKWKDLLVFEAQLIQNLGKKENIHG